LDLAKAELVKKGGDPASLDKGGRQGERVYSVDAVGITICASSGGPGAKTGLYKVGEKIRRLSVKECLAMFGFPDTYVFPDVGAEDALFYLGNSIVVNVPLALVPAIEKWFATV
jgi:DNA (cytosine-5)-methyltransferase 1